MKRLLICSVFCTLFLSIACGSSPRATEEDDTGPSPPVACLPRSVSVELGTILVERARALPRRERRNVCSFIEGLCIDLSVSESPCGGDQVACLSWRGRDDDRACDVIEISADVSRADIFTVYRWFADLLLGK
jgi:hypothetical protein